MMAGLGSPVWVVFVVLVLASRSPQVSKTTVERWAVFPAAERAGRSKAFEAVFRGVFADGWF